MQCPGNLVEPLNSSLPLDFYWQQWFDRGDEPPIPAGAHRPVAEAATEACRTWMGDSQVGGPAHLARIHAEYGRFKGRFVCSGGHQWRHCSTYQKPCCRRWLGLQDPLECWDLTYDHCIPGYTSRNWVPKAVVYNEQKASRSGRETEQWMSSGSHQPLHASRFPTSCPTGLAAPRSYPLSALQVLAQLFQDGAADGDFGKPPVPPSQYSRICVASARAGTGACSRVKPGSYRIHTLGFRPAGLARCDHVTGKTLFVKAHITPKHEITVWGTVGHR